MGRKMTGRYAIRRDYWPGFICYFTDLTAALDYGEKEGGPGNWRGLSVCDTKKKRCVMRNSRGELVFY